MQFSALLTLLLCSFSLASCTPAPAPAPEASVSSSSSAPFVAGDWKNFRKPDEATLRTQLTALQYRVTQEEGTESPYRNEYADEHRDGIYVDIVSGEPLFSSREKYDSGTGWPSFYEPLEPDNVVTKTDYILGYGRTEVRSKYADSHLGHVFEDGPQPTGLRYCMNSASLRFIPKEDLERAGYPEYVRLFVKDADTNGA